LLLASGFVAKRDTNDIMTGQGLLLICFIWSQSCIMNRQMMTLHMIQGKSASNGWLSIYSLTTHFRGFQQLHLTDREPITVSENAYRRTDPQMGGARVHG
jgi:hypothetical protein